MIRTNRPRTAGFTLIETMVVMVLTGIVALGLYQMLHAGRRSHAIKTHQVEMQQNARIAISSLTADFRHVSYGKDPTQPSIRFAGSDSIVYVADLMEEVPGAEVISYYLDPDGDTDTPNLNDTKLVKAVADSGGSVLYVEPQSYGIAQGGLNLRYYNGNGTELASPVPQPEMIGEMSVEVTATEAERWKQQPYGTMQLAATVYPRNLPLTPARSRPSRPACSDPVFPNCTSMTFKWDTPTTNTDGTPLPLAEISHFNFYFGNDQDDLNVHARLARTMNEWTVADLACETYYAAVTCVSRSGVESYPCTRQVGVSVGSRPKPPASLVTIDSLGVKVDWPRVTEFENDETITVPVEYLVYRDDSPGFWPDETNLIATVNETEYHESLSNDCAAYYYQVCAQACCEAGDPSPEAVAYRPSAPQCPYGLMGTSGAEEGTMYLTWSHPTQRLDGSTLLLEEIAETWIYCDTIPGSTERYAAIDGDANYANIYGLTPCTNYYVHARTVDKCGNPSGSNCFGNEISVALSSPCDPPAPSEPGWLTLEALDDRASLTWPANQVDCDLYGYRVYYGYESGVYNGMGATEGYSPIDVPVEAVTYGGQCQMTLSGLEGCRTVYVAVAAIDRCSPPHESPLSPEASGTTSCNPCLIQAGCPTWVATPVDEYRDVRLELYTEGNSDETLARLVPTWNSPARIIQVLYGRPLTQIWNQDGSAGEDGAVGPQESGTILDLDDSVVPSWTSHADGQPLALVFDEDVSYTGFELEFKDDQAGFCTADGTNRRASLFDDFDDGNISGWSVVSGSWSSNDGELYQSSTSGARILVGSQDFSNMTYECKIKVVSGSTSYIIFRYKNSSNFYLLGIKPGSNRILLARYSSGRFRQTASYTVSLDSGRWYNLKVVLEGKTATAYLDCEQVMQYNDRYMQSYGKVGFRTYYAATRYDDVRCQDIAQYP